MKKLTLIQRLWRPVWLAMLALVLTGCADLFAPAIPFSTDGSRADATITMAARVGPYDGIDWEAAGYKVLWSCQNWGYTYYEAFEGTTRQCVETYENYWGSGCSTYLVERIYQCTGDPDGAE